MLQPPEYFESVRNNAVRFWHVCSYDPRWRNIVFMLFELVQNPRHVLSELLQNADDAGATEASVDIDSNEFIFTHNGEDFTKENFASICDFGCSSKRTLATTGFRGIGFKSTFSLGREVCIITPTLAVKFFKERFTEPTWIDCFPFDSSGTQIRVAIDSNGIRDLIKRSLRLWVDSPASLLFCKHVRALKIMGDMLRWTDGDGPKIGHFENWTMITYGLPHNARVLRSAKTPFPQDACEEIRDQRPYLEEESADDFDCSVEIVLGVRCGVYAILPTDEKTSLPFACNAPFVQKPNRVGILSPISSPTNRWLLERVGTLAAEGMMAWLEDSYLEMASRCEAYSLMPSAPDAQDPMADPCLDAVARGFCSTVIGRRILLSENGILHPIGRCVSVPRELLDVWPAEVVASIVGKEGEPILSRCIRTEHLTRLRQWNWVSAKSKKDILTLLRNRTTCHVLHRLISF
jgi:hypothetical protein